MERWLRAIHYGAIQEKWIDISKILLFFLIGDSMSILAMYSTVCHHVS
jgi:hypothetical protein